MVVTGVTCSHLEGGAGHLFGHFIDAPFCQANQGEGFGESQDIRFFGQGLFDQSAHTLAVGGDGRAAATSHGNGGNTDDAWHRTPF